MARFGDHDRMGAGMMPSDESRSRVAMVKRNRAILGLARARGLLSGRKVRITARVSSKLVRAAKRRTGISSTDKLLELALAAVALRDDFAMMVVPRKPSPRRLRRSTADEYAVATGEALEAARERGRVRAAEISAGPEMLNTVEFAKLLGESRAALRTMHLKRQVLALPGPKRAFRFPRWQIDRDGTPFRVLPELFDRLDGSPWSVYRFLIQMHPELDGLTGLDALQRGRYADVLAAAESIALGAFS